MAKVDGFLTAAELSRQMFETLVPVPKFKVVLVNTNFESQIDVLATHRVHIVFHANDAVGLHREENGCTCRPTLRRQGVEHRDFFAESLPPRGVSAADQLANEILVIVNTDEVAASSKSQCLIERILEVAM